MAPRDDSRPKPRYGLLAASLAGLGLIASAAPSGCQDLRCCNSCGRNFYVGESLDESVAWLANLQDGGNECEIGEIEPTFGAGVHTLVATVSVRNDVEDGSTYQLMVEAHQPGDASEDLCAGLEPLGVEELRAAALEPGARLCLVAPIASETLCTQKACGLES